MSKSSANASQRCQWSQRAILSSMLLSGWWLSPASAVAVGIPKVGLSAEHKQLCKVGVADALPTLTTDGKAVPFVSPPQRVATVLAFVGHDGWMSRQLLKDLGPDVTKKFGGKGVEVIATFVSRQPPKNLKFKTQTDPQGKRFALLGSGGLPRVYILDSKGKIVWFDIEYSATTRREIRQTLQVLTGGK